MGLSLLLASYHKYCGFAMLFSTSRNQEKSGDDTTTSLGVWETGTSPQPMTLGHVFYATETCLETSVNDPMCRYLWGSQNKKGGFAQAIWRRISFFAIWCYFLRHRRAWTVESGRATLGYTDPTDRPGLVDELVDSVLYLVYLSHMLLNTWEQHRRHFEIMHKVEVVSNQVLGEKRKWMLQVDTLATAPMRQNCGYGSALVRVVTEKADLELRGAWLISSNVEANTRFYNALGFHTVATIFAGDSNPTWQEEPVPIAIMVREQGCVSQIV